MPSTLSEVEALADRWRATLSWEAIRQAVGGDADKAFYQLRQHIEGMGIFCLMFPTDPSEIRGASIWLEGRPFILISSADREAATGRLFTLMHEFAHLLWGEESSACDFRESDATPHSMEKLANRFAAHFLLPPARMEEYLKSQGIYRFKADWSNKKLDRLRKDLLVSRDVIAITLEKQNLAPAGFYERRRSEWNAKKSFARGRKKSL